MNTSHLKLAGIAAILAVVALGSVYLFARPPAPAPNASAISPSLAAVTAAVVAATPAPALGTTSTQPKITWSTTSVQVILSPGESTSSDLTFTSSLTLSNIIIEPVPAIASFVSIQPNAFASVPANQAQFVHIALSIPAGTTLGTYDGTIHLRSGSTTYPQTVKVTVNVWKAFRDDVVGFSVKLPAGFSVSTTTNERPNFLGQITITGPTEGETIDISKYSNADSLSLEQWYERTLFSHEYTGTWSTLDPSSTLVTAIVLNGQPALQVISEVFGYRMKRTFIAFGPTVIEFEEGFPRDEGESSTTVKLLSTLRTM